ncbi:hypothetical protein [Enterocloster clostridioformis]|uniref:hypothetical protein n=1 Tax=Enterocloster clostridioformis TaxID=1531 RepID=UPI0022E2E480|nr:hypothetical protein [Enterocloster clostridioformis]
MNRNLSPTEYEGLEYILSRLVAEHEHQQGIKPEDRVMIHILTKRTSTGINFTGPYGKYYVIDDFALQGIYLQDGTTILIAYKLAPDSAEPARQEFPIYIDMRDFMDCESFDLDYLVWKMREHR